MRMTVVGSGDAFGSGGRFQTCVALALDQASPSTVLLDCGATSLTALRQQEIDTNAVGTVIVSHLYGYTSAVCRFSCWMGSSGGGPETSLSSTRPARADDGGPVPRLEHRPAPLRRPSR